MTSGAPGPRRALLPDQSGSGGSVHTLTTSRQPSHALDPLSSKRICFYKSGDPQFGGLRMVINRRTFKSFEALLDSLSKKVPLPFGVRNITTPRGVHAVHTLDQLEDGKSYICSDSRKVKPINLAQARKKLPPWYNARPGTGRRRVVQLARMYPGGGKPQHPEPVVLRTLRRLTMCRNGEPATRQTVTLKKKSMQSFEVLLEHLSELMQFPVVKLHTADGRRVDGLPALILCSGMVVAAGKEPFKPGNYYMQRSPAPKWPPANRLGLRKIRSMHRKSSQAFQNVTRYFLNQIHNSISESMCDYPSNPTDSIELENSHMLESVAETDAESCPDHGTHEQGSCLPMEDDIEKSFRVNQDGSMTVEMKVRLTLKEEETIHWTTTLTRSSMANQLLPDCFPEPEPEAGSELEQESGSPTPNRPDQSHPAVPIETMSSNKPWGGEDDNEPPPLESDVSIEEGNMEDEVMVKTSTVMSARRVPTPGFKKAKTSTERMRDHTAETVQDDTVQSYSYRAETEQYRMIQQSSTRPVPKPRRLASMDVNYRYDQAEFNSAGISEVLQIENNGEEVTETVLHIYEQQTCQGNFYANTHNLGQGVSMYGAHYGRPSTSDTAWSMNADVEPQFGRPSTASESIHTWRADSTLPSSDITPCKSLVINTQNKLFSTSKDSSQLSPESGKDKHHHHVADKGNKTSSNTKAIKKHVQWIKSPGNGRKKTTGEASKNRKKVTPFSSSGFLKKIYGGRPRPVKTTMKRNKRSTEKEKVRPATESSHAQDVTRKCTIKDPNMLSSGDDKKQETIPFNSNMLDVSPTPRAMLTHQKSIHDERRTHKASAEVPVFISSSSFINEYVEHWLENSTSQHALRPSDQTQAVKVLNQVGLEGGIPEGSEVNCNRIKPGHTEGETGMRESLTKQRIKTLQSGPPLEKSTACDSSTDKISQHINSSQDKIEKSDTKQTPKDMSVPSSAMQYTLSSTSSQTSADRPLFVSPSADQAPSPPDHPKTTTSISSLSAEREELLSRNRDDPLQTTISSIPIQTADGDTLESNSLVSMKTKEPTEIPLERLLHADCILDQTSMASSLSFCTSVSPVSSSSEERVSLSSPASSDASYVAKPSANEADSTKTQSLSSTQTETLSPKPFTRKVKVSELSLEKKLSIRRAQCEASAIRNDPPAEEIPLSNSLSLKRTQLPRNQSLKSASSHKPSMDSSKANALSSPPSESPSPLHKTYSQKKTSPYSQSLDLVSPPVKQRTKKNLVPKNHSPDKGSELTNQTLEEPEIPQRNRLQQDLSEETLVDLEPDLLEKIETGISATILNTGLNESERDTQPLELTNQPDLKSVLEKICFSIKSIRQITQNKRPSCLEKSNSLPDFSGHVATTFGSSSKALLAFLAVMTLKEELTHIHKCELDGNNVSCAEALKLIDSLREIASIEDSDQLKTSLSELQKSTSTQFIQSWKSFQELRKSCRSMPNKSEEELRFGRSSVEYCGTEEAAIDELMEELQVPETLKQELAAFHVCSPTERDDSGSVGANPTEKPSDDNVTTNSEEDTVNGRDCVQTGKANVDVEAPVDVKAMVKRFTDPEKPANPKQQNLSDDQKAVHTQKTHNREDSTTDFKDTVLLQEEQHPISAPQVSIEDNKEVVSRSNGKKQKVEEEVEQDSLKKNQPIKLHVPYMDLEETTEESHEEKRCSSEGKHWDRESMELDRNSDDSMFSPGEVSSSDEERKHILSTEGRHRNICNPETQQKLSSPEGQRDVELRQLKQVRNNNMSDYKSLSSSEEEEHRLQHTNRFKRSSVTTSSTQTSSQDVEDPTSSEDDQHVDIQQLSRTNARSVHSLPPVDKQIRQKLTKMESLSERSEENVSTPDAEDLMNLEKDRTQVHRHEHQEQLSCTEAMLNPVCKAVELESKQHITNRDQRLGRSLSRPDTEAMSSDQDQPTASIDSCMGENLNSEGSSCSQNVAEQSRSENELPEVECKEIKDIIKEHFSGHEEASQGSVEEEEEEEEEEEKDSSVFKQAHFLDEPGFKLDEDNERDQESYEDHTGEDDTANPGNGKCGSPEDEISYGEKDLRSEERHDDQGYQEQHVHGKPSPEDTPCQRAATNQKAQPAEISQSVAERIGLLKKQVAETQWKSKIAGGASIRILAEKDALDVESSTPDTKITRALPGSRSAPQSSLSFSYDSSSIITRQPEGARVQTIKEMFMAKSVPDVQCEDGDVHGLISSDPNPASQSQDSDVLSEAGSIAKGFVRRTIERLYGRKDPTAGDNLSERPTSSPKQMKESSSIFSSLHSAGSKLRSDMPYFNSTNTLDTLSEATRCMSFNTQVGPDDSLPIDQDRSPNRKSILDPVGVKVVESPLLDKDPSENTKQEVPISLFSTNSETGDKSAPTKCTYFSLPCTSDSELGPEEPGAVSKNGESGVDIKEDKEDKGQTERNGTLPGLRLHDNKVHPLTQGPPGGQVVVVQPGRGQGVRPVRPVELDALDALYTFCGQHCPIL
ncbi:Oxygen-regulated protein 1 [Merluccius polli]|uniref:Oxygen-regulated protein 1 n=1 Tax=Merluccius polli TaxID=89951 RepID=A0AA47MKE2_MERPO|nr:Oxygen-regulated protein 1 [Merluccius polli]